MKRSFADAFRGLLACARSERNFRFHLAVTFYVVLAGFITRLDGTEWAAVLLCIGAVTGAELFNTAVEKLCDALCPKFDRRIGLVKDLTAGGVLMLAAASAAVGIVIFFQSDKIARAVCFARAHSVMTALIVLSVQAAVDIVFRRYEHDKENSDDHDRGTSQRR